MHVTRKLFPLLVPFIRHSFPTAAINLESCGMNERGDCMLDHESMVSWGDPTCVDLMPDECSMRAAIGECAKYPDHMLGNCPLSCALCNNHHRNIVRTCYGAPQTANEIETLELIRRMQSYMLHHVYQDEKYRNVRVDCKNRSGNCAYWARIGECERNAKYMKLQCAPACQTCQLLDYDTRCPFNATEAERNTLWNKQGDVDRFFLKLALNDTYRYRYQLTILSAPNEYKSKVDVMSNDMDGPWLVQLEDFLSPSECDRLISLGYQMGYERSKDIGQRKFDGTHDSYTSKDRTSTTAWCNKDSGCQNDPVAAAVTDRIEQLTSIPRQNWEYMQLLRYEVGQFYGVHHDYSPFHRGRPPGVRILTVFLYLNDLGLKGGGTNFPSLNLTVYPQRGRVLIWPSVRDSRPGSKDIRTKHQALPVEAGIKYGANVWIHERDFRTSHDMGCAR